MFNPFSFLKTNANDRVQNSLSAKLRKKRFELFLKTFNPNNKTKIIDIGGTEIIWRGTEFEQNVTILNLNFGEKDSRFKYVYADACNSGIKSKSYDVAYSNSVIEHVGDYERQKQFASEIQRIAKSYYIQTPNKHFPLEQHFLFPFFQYLPKKLKLFIGLKWKFSTVYIGGEDYLRNEIENIRLLTKRELQELFPNAIILKEKFFGLTKSFIVIGKSI